MDGACTRVIPPATLISRQSVCARAWVLSRRPFTINTWVLEDFKFLDYALAMWKRERVEFLVFYSTIKFDIRYVPTTLEKRDRSLAPRIYFWYSVPLKSFGHKILSYIQELDFWSQSTRTSQTGHFWLDAYCPSSGKPYVWRDGTPTDYMGPRGGNFELIT